MGRTREEIPSSRVCGVFDFEFGCTYSYYILVQLPGMSDAQAFIPSLQVTIKTNLLAELKHQAPK